jgi:hypothetical protein
MKIPSLLLCQCFFFFTVWQSAVFRYHITAKASLILTDGDNTGRDGTVRSAFTLWCEKTNEKALYDSILSDLSKISRRNSSNIKFITSSTRDILSYSAYAMFINAVYSLVSNADFQIYDEDVYKMEVPLDADARWNKVKYLMDEINLNASHPEWIVWLDADLIVVDWSLNITQLVSQYPQAEIIMSKDKVTAPFVSNSGFIIVRNSLWSYQFLDLWWNTYNRKTCCDQNALTWLYQRKVPANIQEKIVLLEADAINTNFPSWENHHEHCSVLHLAGLTSIYRKKIFQKGFSEICSRIINYSSSDKAMHSSDLSFLMNSLPPQLRINKKFLQSTLTELNDMRLRELQTLSVQLDTLADEFPDRVTTPEFILPYFSRLLLKITAVRRRIDDTMKYEDDERMWTQKYYLEQGLNYQRNLEIEKEISFLLLALRFSVFARLSQHVLLQFEQINSFCDESTKTDSAVSIFHADHSCMQYLDLLQSIVTSGFEALVAFLPIFKENPNSTFHYNYRNILSSVSGIIQNILLRIEDKNPVLEGVFYYYLFKHHQFLLDFISIERDGELYSVVSDDSTSYSFQTIQEEKTFLLADSIRIWQLLIDKYRYYGTTYVIADPEKEYIEILFRYGTELCFHHNYSMGVSFLSQSISKQQQMIDDYQKIYIATNSVIRSAKIRLSEFHYNYGLCLMDDRLDVVALKEFNKVVDLLQSIQAEGERPIFQSAVGYIKKLNSSTIPETSTNPSQRIVRLKKKKKRNV